jgi:hypothetical protein
MACPILVNRARCTWGAGLILFFVSLSAKVGEAGPGVASPRACPKLASGSAELQQQYEAFRTSVEKGPFYKTALKRLGAARTCNMKVEEQTILLSYEFERGASLVTKRDPSIEFSEQRLNMNTLDQHAAVALLREAERDFFSSERCGIAWHASPQKEEGTTAGAYELVYRGDVCNCQGRLLYQKGALVTLIFRSAC